MRSVFVLLAACSGTPRTEPPVEPVQRVAVVVDAAPAPRADAGCPDTTNRLIAPIAIQFTGRVSAPVEITFDEDVQLVDVIGRSNLGVKHELAASRAALIARRLRPTTKATIVEHVTGATRLYADDTAGEPRGDVIVQVIRAGDVEIYRWVDDQLVRATPLPPGC